MVSSYLVIFLRNLDTNTTRHFVLCLLKLGITPIIINICVIHLIIVIVVIDHIPMPLHIAKLLLHIRLFLAI